MIPRVRPSYGLSELRAAVRPECDAVKAFEEELAQHFGMRHALTFPYGRSAIHACLRAMNLTGGVVQPAYNCVVVAHATMLAGCRPVFVDVEERTPNQSPDEMAAGVNGSTVAAIPTSMFGVTFDAAALCDAIRRRNRNTFILIDCCQSFDARWRSDLLAAQGDAAVLAFGIGKPMTTLYGGALLSNRDDVAEAVRRYRAATFTSRPRSAVLRRWLYFLMSWAAFSGPLVGLTDFIENTDSPVHRYLLKLRAREAIRLPGDNQALMMPLEAAIGRQQLKRVCEFVRRRHEIAALYARELSEVPGLDLLNWPDGSWHGIYAARLREPKVRATVLAAMRYGGVQGDATLGYVVPGLDCYRAAGFSINGFPNAVAWSQSVINLPSHPTLTDQQVLQVIHVVRNALGERNGANTSVPGHTAIRI